MNNINTVVFDLDGTLLDTLDDLANSVNFALSSHGYPQRSKDEIRSFLGNGIESLMHKSLPTGISQENFEISFQCFREHYVQHCLDLTKPYPGIMQLLKTLKEKGVKMAIVSNKLDPAVKELNQRFFSQYIDSAVGESATVRRKPNPDAVITALHNLGSSKENAVYVGDSEVDIETSKNAGIACICVTWGFRDKEFLTQLKPEILIDNPSEILQHLP